MASVLQTAHRAGKDVEGFELIDNEGTKHWVNSAAYGYENAVNSIKATLQALNCTPIDAVLVLEGMNAKAKRLMISRDYKANRGKAPYQAYDEYNKCKDLVVEAFRSLGAIAVTQDNVEGDDVVTYIARNSQEDCWVVSNDNDLAALYGVNKRGARVQVRINGVCNENKYGDFPLHHITLYKAMVGDTSDKISGITGFGPAKWIDFHAKFGESGMDEMVRLAELGDLSELEEEAEQDKTIRLIWNGRADFLRCYKLAKLHDEWVDTMADPLVWMPGLVLGTCSDERLKAWRGVTRLVTSESWDTFFTWFKLKMQDRPWLSLDIETSSADESDEWLESIGKPDGVDTIGSTLTGMSLTFGANMHYTVYISVDHKDTSNVERSRVLELLKYVASKKSEIVIHNTFFEGPVLFNEFGEQWKDNGYHGFLPNWLDTKLEASYVDENFSLGLKKLSKRWLNYDQTEYSEVTTIDGVKHKMNELTAKHVLSYACDDTITTAALHNFFKLFMGIEGTYDVYKKVEISASYLHAQSFVHGTRIDLKKLSELQQEDAATYSKAWAVVRDYLIKKGWDGTATPVYASPLVAAAIKEAYNIVTGDELKTMVRTPAKLIEMVRGADSLLAACFDKALEDDFSDLNSLVARNFKGEPSFNTGSPKQLQRLFYEVMELPIVVFNKPTDAARARGEKQGTAKTDNLAIAYALADLPAEDERVSVLESLRIMKMVQTREGLYYSTYPSFVHWKTGRIHSSHNQCATNTRRASSSVPNVQQLAKNGKIEGYSPRIRELFIPHKRNAVVVSMDFASQEILLQAEWSMDPALVDVFVGDNPKDMHSITGVKIFNTQQGLNLTYDEFREALFDKDNEHYAKVKAARALAKAVNFGSQYRIAAKKLSTMLFVTEQEAQVMLDAKAEAFPVAEQWALEEMSDVKRVGKVRTMLGAVRHLREALTSPDRIISGKADRQAISFRIQGSAAEMTKLAEGRIWEAGLEQKYDCEFIAPVHDECVASVSIEDLVPFLKEMHKCMVADYAGMKLPIKSSIAFGKSFGPADQIEIGDWPTEEAIEKGLAELAG
jgi:DNA polymerase I-like protein with 3'-5' exonuclease and polymerase domains/5'-3' exonuclease